MHVSKSVISTSVAGLGLAGLLTAGVFISPALANGGDFFTELSQSWGANVDTGTPYFGFVRDANGKPVPRAIVTATVTNGTDGQAVTIIADNLGHYRIPGLGTDVDPKKVLIECAKAGYHVISLDRRVMRSVPKAPVEVDCKMAPLNATS